MSEHGSHKRRRSQRSRSNNDMKTTRKWCRYDDNNNNNDVLSLNKTIINVHSDMPQYVGGSLVAYPLLVMNNVVLCCSTTCVRVYNAVTGQRVATLSGHTSIVTAIVAHPQNMLQVLSCSLDGTIKAWDLSDFSLIDTYNVDIPILHAATATAASTANRSDVSVVYLNVNPKYQQQQQHHRQARGRRQGRKACRVIEFDLVSRTHKLLYKSRQCSGLAVSNDGRLVATISGCTISMWSTHTHKLLKLQHTHVMTTIAFHPLEPYFATGDVKGRISFWNNFEHLLMSQSTSDNGTGSDVVISHLHWHAHSVASMVFTTDGSYLLSGGEEAVLVLWQLDSGHKQFLPRLGAPICSIAVSPNSRLYCISCSNNQVLTVDAVSSEVVQSIKGLQYAHSFSNVPRSLLNEITIDHKHKCAILSGTPGSLQFYDVLNDRHKCELRVVSRNWVSRVDIAQSIPTRVECVDVNHDASWLATVERRADGESTETVTLKFWHLPVPTEFACHDQSGYILNTRIRAPHSEQIRTVRFHPTRNLVLTASRDRKFKIWELQNLDMTNTTALTATMTQNERDFERDAASSQAWRCCHVGRYRDYPLNDACFSHDGSLLAVTYGQVITLWACDRDFALVNVLSHSSASSPVLRIAFAARSPYLVAFTARNLCVWNLLTVSVWWSYSVRTVGLAVHFDAPYFAVVVNGTLNSGGVDDGVDSDDGDKEEEHAESTRRKPKQHRHRSIVLFNAESPIPVTSWTTSDVLVNAHSQQAAVNFVPSRDGTSSLTYMTNHHEIARFDDVFGMGTTDRVQQVDDVVHNGYGAQVPADMLNAKNSTPTPPTATQNYYYANDDNYQRFARVMKLFDGPVHTLPSLDTMCAEFFDILARSTVDGNGDDTQQADVHEVDDVEMKDSDDHAMMSTTMEAAPPISEIDAVKLSATCDDLCSDIWGSKKS